MTVRALTPPADTVARQRAASNPAASAWVSANAGSGKTHVLAQRVVRLLLSGVAPARILCLTFTKAAAANMANRVFRDLAAWTTLDDAALAAAITETGAPAPSGTDLDAARRLFARTVETPGGLKIQTIHAFCERLLHLFPFEANVPARFEVLEDVRATDLLLRAREAALAQAMASPESDLGRAVAALAREVSVSTFDEVVAESLTHRHVIRAATRGGDAPDRLADLMRGAFELSPGETAASVERTIIEDGLAPARWGEVARRIGADGGDKRKAGNRLAMAAAAPAAARCASYLEVFLTEGEARDDKYLPKLLRNAEPALCAELDAERERLRDLAPRRNAARTAERTAALVTVAGAILQSYDTAKQRRGLLDFDDLVERTRGLLEHSGSAWVLYKLDRGIDHILVDEAQDTSPGQWEILRAISEEFFAGSGRSQARRTLFAVGDEKQSIYSFQGARPDMFAAMRADVARRVADAEHTFESVDLLLSFRSSKAVLDAVDRVFAHPANARGLAGDAAGPRPHQPLKTMPGLVEIWPPVKASKPEDPIDWRLPLDVVDPGEPPVVLARRLAEAIARMTDRAYGETVEDNQTGRRRPVRAGDIMILVRTRSAFFEVMIRALKERGLPVAGADRLAMTEHIAVMDLMAAGRAALSPAEDFTLACVLKSPLIGLDDDDLIALAPPRKGTLIDALEASPAPAHRAAAAKLDTWRDRAGHLTPFAFYSRLLGADGGRRDLLARLGPEAGDAIDEFLALAIAHEREGAPSLLAFLARLEGADLSIKRDMDAAGDAVRVMTVHAAKGLEAKIVFLPDTCAVPTGRHDPKLFLLGETEGAEPALVAWSQKKGDDPVALAELRQRSQARALEEHNRLLYVAMTRAEERLYIAGACGEKGPPGDSWFGIIERAGLPLEPASAFWDAGETIGRFRDPPAPPAGEDEAAAPKAALAPALPGWLHRPPPHEEAIGEPPVRPSNPLGAADQFSPVAWAFGERHRNGRESAAAAGRLMHKLLQHLPDVEAGLRRAAAARFLGAQGHRFDEARRETMIEHALRVVGDARLAPLFGAGSRAEVAVAGTVRLPSGRRIEVTGQIDRIGLADDAVFLADFKTGVPAREPSAKHVLQLALYEAAVAPLYPDLPIRAFLVWTAEPRVVEIEPADLDAARRSLE